MCSTNSTTSSRNSGSSVGKSDVIGDNSAAIVSEDGRISVLAMGDLGVQTSATAAIESDDVIGVVFGVDVSAPRIAVSVFSCAVSDPSCAVSDETADGALDAAGLG